MYELTPKQSKFTATILHSFAGGKDGAYPYAGPIRDEYGDLFGTATNGGSANYGVVFELKPSGKQYRENILYSFGSGSDASTPTAGCYSGLTACFTARPTAAAARMTGRSSPLRRSPVAVLLVAFTGEDPGGELELLEHRGVVVLGGLGAVAG